MGWILLLIAMGILLFVVELILMPGVGIAGIGALASLVGAVTLSFVWMGALAGFLVLGGVFVLIVICTVYFLRAKTWRKASLTTEITGTISPAIDTLVPIGTQGTTITRLSPMGTVIIEGVSYQAKSLDQFIDQRVEVVVTGYDNQTIIVKKKN